MKYFFQIYSTISFIILLSLPANANPSTKINACRFEVPSSTPKYPRGEYPPIYQLKPLDKIQTEAIFSIRVRGDGIGILHPLSNAGILKDLDLPRTKELLGEPSSQSNSEYVFNLITTDAKEPNIFHVDIQTDQSGKLTSYRVRGYGISNPEWLKIQQ